MFIEKESKQCNYEIEENKDSITFDIEISQEENII